jgi:hypothetical protein
LKAVGRCKEYAQHECDLISELISMIGMSNKKDKKTNITATSSKQRELDMQPILT